MHAAQKAREATGYESEKVEQLKRAKARKLKEEQLRLELKLDNQSAEGEVAAELADTKAQFYEELEDAASVVCRASSVHDIRSEEQPKHVKPKLTFKESKEQFKGLDIMEHELGLKDERPLSRVPLAENSVPTDIPLFSSTPGGATVLKANVKRVNQPVPKLKRDLKGDQERASQEKKTEAEETSSDSDDDYIYLQETAQRLHRVKKIKSGQSQDTVVRVICIGDPVSSKNQDLQKVS
ncbi:hypothetical protein ACROYT_G016058 [Oculina patagonica]